VGWNERGDDGVLMSVVTEFLQVSGQRTPRAIAERALAKDRFTEAALRLQPDLCRVARHMTWSSDAADELVQDAYVRAFRSWESFEAGTNLRAWLVRIMTNLHIDNGRRNARSVPTVPFIEAGVEASSHASHDEGDTHLDRLSQQGAVVALSALPDTFRETLVLFDIAGFSGLEVAAILNIPFGTVMSRVFRARRMISAELSA
jgi:RNA polymerase sigma-70 factor (ECF subfamily)